MSDKYNEYCMNFSNKELKTLFCEKFSENLCSKLIYLAEDGSRININSDSKIETIAFDEDENIAITFWEYQTSIYVFDKELMFIDEDCKGTYTSSDVYDNAVYEGRMRKLNHKEMLNMFAEVILCFIEAKSMQIIQLDVPDAKGYQRYNY